MKIDIPGLVFDKKEHRYYYQGQEVPGVTRVIKTILQQPSKIPKKVMDNAAELGTLVHEATELLDKDVLDWDTVDQEVVPYLKAWQRFVEERRCEILSVEDVLWHSEYRYAGIRDRKARMDGVIGSIDIKTGTYEHWHRIQGAAYSAAENVGKPYIEQSKRQWGVYLNERGDYKVVDLTDTGATSIFMSALVSYRWRQEHG